MGFISDLFGGGDQNVTQTTKVELTPEQKELQKLALGQIRPLFDSGQSPQLPALPGFDPTQMQAQEGVLAKAGPGGQLSELTNNLVGGQNFLLNDAIDVNNNPALQGAIDAAIRPLTDQYLGTVLPSLRTEAVTAGALGDPKQQIAAQRAAEGYQRQVGDTAATITSDAYGRGLEALTRGVALGPQTQSAALFPEAASEGVGAQRRQLSVDQQQRGFQQDTLPLSIGVQLLNAASGAPGGGSTATVQPAQPGGGWTQALGSGLSAISMLAGIPGLF